MHRGKGAAHLVERRFRHGSDLLFGVRVVHRNRTIPAAISADFATDEAHRIKLIVKNELFDHRRQPVLLPCVVL